jgi:quercetin dioxygenase-like cupin family protein
VNAQTLFIGIVSAALMTAAKPVLAQEPTKPVMMLKDAVTGMPKGDKQEIRVLTASFVPGQATVFHTHRFPVTVFMLEGTFTLEMEGRPPVMAVQRWGTV